MKFSLAKAPFLRSKRSTTGIMLELFAVLAVVWLVAVVSYSIRFNFLVGLRAIFVVLISLITTLAVDVIVALLKGKRKVKEIGNFVLTSYSYVTAIIFALCLPVGVSYYAVIIGSIVATLLGKYLFGGFGYNIFNPAIIGRIFVGLAFGASLNYGIVANETNSAAYDFVTSSTVTSSINWAEGAIPEGYDFKTILFGNYNGAMGETFTILLVVAAIYLIIRGIVNYRLMLSYLLTITGISFALGLFYGVDNVLNYTLLQLATGGIMFASVFMITDPVTSPKSMNGKIIFGIGAAALTMFIRINSDYPEGVMFSVALMNMLNPLIDSCIKGTTFTKLGVKWTIIAAFFVGAIGVNVGYSALYPLEKVEKNTWLNDYTVEKLSDSEYTVSSAGFKGTLKFKVTVNASTETITSVEILERSPSEYYSSLESSAIYGAVIGNDKQIKFGDLDNFKCENKVCENTTDANVGFDVESSATYTTSAFIGNLKAVVETVRGGAK